MTEVEGNERAGEAHAEKEKPLRKKKKKEKKIVIITKKWNIKSDL